MILESELVRAGRLKIDMTDLAWVTDEEYLVHAQHGGGDHITQGLLVSLIHNDAFGVLHKCVVLGMNVVAFVITLEFVGWDANEGGLIDVGAYEGRLPTTGDPDYIGHGGASELCWVKVHVFETPEELKRCGVLTLTQGCLVMVKGLGVDGGVICWCALLDMGVTIPLSERGRR
jgi:hypothetical protein